MPHSSFDSPADPSTKSETSGTASDLPLLTELDFTVKTYDIDFAGHVNNNVYVRWLEDLRFALLERYLPLEPLMESGVVPLVVETTVRYRRPVNLFEPVHGRMWMDSRSRVRVSLRAEFTVAGDLRVEAVQSGAFVDLRTGRPRRVPESLPESPRTPPRSDSRSSPR
jgi:acyl-CoA thioester hydrolase